MAQAARGDSAEEREALLRSILETVPDAMVIIDADGIVQAFSATAERLFGYAATEVIGLNVSMLMPGADRVRHDDYMARYMRTGERRIIGVGRVVVGVRKTGETFPMHLSVGEARTAGKRLFTGFIRDLTERQEAQRRLSELQSRAGAHGPRHGPRRNGLDPGARAQPAAHRRGQLPQGQPPPAGQRRGGGGGHGQRGPGSGRRPGPARRRDHPAPARVRRPRRNGAPRGAAQPPGGGGRGPGPHRGPGERRARRVRLRPGRRVRPCRPDPNSAGSWST